MQTLSVLAVEGDEIIVVSPSGERFRLPVDASLRARLQSPAPGADAKRLSPREIQAHVRSGLSTEQVAALTGVPVAHLERFVGPVLAERAYIVESALAVRLPPETEGARSRTFGAVMSDRLASLAARDVVWSSAKEPSGWVLAVSFAADGVEHAARWRFDPKHMALEPDNVEASTLSQQGTPAALTPRLRAIEPTAPVTIVPRATAAPATESDRSRFDSAVFQLPDLTAGRRDEPATRRSPGAPTERPAARRAPEPRPEERPRDAPRGPGTTTDQLTALARRRDRRDPPGDAALPDTRAMDVVPPEPRDLHPARPTAPRPAPGRAPQSTGRRTPLRDEAAETAPLKPADLRRARERLRDDARSAPEAPAPQATSRDRTEQPGRPRRGRTSMPSWDEIVFGRDET